MSDSKPQVPETDRWFPNSMPAPMVDHHTLPFWEACGEQRLTVQCCTHCHHAQHPPAPICSECRHNEFEQVAVSGEGTLYTYTAVHQPVTFEEKLPFIIAVVELDVSGTDCGNSVTSTGELRGSSSTWNRTVSRASRVSGKFTTSILRAGPV